MGILGKIDHTLGVKLAAHVKAVHIALGAAGGNVAPGILGVESHHGGETGDDLPFDFVGIGPVIAVVKGVAHVVSVVLQEGQQLRVIEIQIGRVAEQVGRCLVKGIL